MGGLTIGPVPTLSSDDAFAEVKAKVDLVKVVQEHVRLSKRNRDLWGLWGFVPPGCLGGWPTLKLGLV